MTTEKTYTIEEMYETLCDCVSQEAVDLVVNINGYSRETMLDILYAATGLRDFADLRG